MKTKSFAKQAGFVLVLAGLASCQNSVGPETGEVSFTFTTLETQRELALPHYGDLQMVAIRNGGERQVFPFQGSRVSLPRGVFPAVLVVETRQGGEPFFKKAETLPLDLRAGEYDGVLYPLTLDGESENAVQIRPGCQKMPRQDISLFPCHSLPGAETRPWNFPMRLIFDENFSPAEAEGIVTDLNRQASAYTERELFVLGSAGDEGVLVHIDTSVEVCFAGAGPAFESNAVIGSWRCPKKEKFKNSFSQKHELGHLIFMGHACDVPTVMHTAECPESMKSYDYTPTDKVRGRVWLETLLAHSDIKAGGGGPIFLIEETLRGEK